MDSVAEREFEATRRVTDSQVRALAVQSVFAVVETDLCTSYVDDEGSATHPSLSRIRVCSLRSAHLLALTAHDKEASRQRAWGTREDV